MKTEDRLHSYESYIEQFLSPPSEVIRHIDRQYAKRTDLEPPIGPHVGALLRVLILSTGAKKAIEFGTCIGYSTLYLAEALQLTGGHLIAIEAKESNFRDTATHLEQAGLREQVELIHGDAAEELAKQDGPFDFSLQDAKKSLYPIMLDELIEKTRPGGIIAADDGLFVPMGMRADIAQPLHEYNLKVFADGRLRSTIVPIGDGLTLSVRL